MLDDVIIDSTTHYLENGIVWIRELVKNPERFAIVVGSPAGWELEPTKDLGAVHLAEHLLVDRASPTDTVEFKNRLRKRNVFYNASSEPDHVYYWFEGPHKEWAYLTRQAFRNLSRTYTQEQFNVEREALGTELLSDAGNPHLIIDSATLKRLYPRTRYAVHKIDAVDAIDSLTLEQVLATRDRLFQASNLVIVTISDENTQVHDVMEKTFMRMARTNPPVRYDCLIHHRNQDRIDVANAHKRAATIAYTFPFELAHDRGQKQAALRVLADLLQCDLYDAVRELGGGLYQINDEFGYHRPEAQIQLKFDTKPKNVEWAIGVYNDVLHSRMQQGFTRQELREAKSNAQSHWEKKCEDYSWRAQWYFSNINAGLDDLAAKEFSHRLRMVRHDDVEQALYEGFARMLVAVGHPNSTVRRVLKEPAA